MVGQTLGHYRIESKLGEGGMGVVYKARDTHLDRSVAIKVLPADKVADPGRKQRFVQEAKSASSLNHPNIVTIHDIRSEDGVDFIVMEYIEGKTLDELISADGMRLVQGLKCAVQIADALAKAHRAGILHRDLKPSNIMVTEEERIKILDFGLAKLLEPPDCSPEAPTLTMRELTEEGAVVGTVAYMSPEQVQGSKLDVRSDIFSFGSVLYKMMTGRKPFSGNSNLSVMAKILQEDPTPPSQLVATIPPELEKLILRCLRKDPGRRIQQIADLKLALEELQDESASARRQPSAARIPRRGWIWAASLAVLLIAGFFAWQAWRAPQPTEPLRAVALTAFPGAELDPSFSPDGNRVAFTWTGPKQDNSDIYVQQIGAGTPLRLTTDPRVDFNPVWSPDGRWIAFLRGQRQGGKRELRLIAPLGGPERKVTETVVRDPYVFPPHLTWYPDSSHLVVTDSPGEGKPDALFVVSVETGEKRQLTNPESTALGDGNPAVSRDGRSLVYCHNRANGATELYLLPLRRDVSADGEAKRLTSVALSAEQPTWMPDSKEILFSARGSLWRLPIPGRSPPIRIPFVGEDGSMPVVSRPQPGHPSRLVYVRSFMDRNIWRIDTSAPGVPSSSPAVVAISSTRQDHIPYFSPDGRHVSFSSDRSGENEGWVADPDGSNAVQLTSMGAQFTAGGPWSPDGHWIALISNLEGQVEIYLIASTGGKPRRLTFHPANDEMPSFSRDGKWIYFASNRTGDYQIWKIPVSGGDAVQITHNVGFAAQESVDGAFVFYTQTQRQPSALWRLPVSGGQPVKVLEGVILRAFVVLEKGIYYIDRPADETRLEFFDFVTGKSVTVARNLGPVQIGLAASPNGRTILYSRIDSSIDDLMLVENFR